MHQNFFLNPFLDGFLVRNTFEVFVEIAKPVDGQVSIFSRPGWIIEADFSLQLMYPYHRRQVVIFLMPGIKKHFLEDLVLDVLNEIYERNHKQFF